MALFYHGLSQTDLALRHMSRAMVLLGLSSGADHPDVAATFINVAMLYQDIGYMKAALRYLQEALTRNERLLGKEHIQTAVCYHALAIACNCMGLFKLSHQMDAQKQKGQSLDAASTQRALDILKANPDLIHHAVQAATAGGGASGSSSSAVNKTISAALVGETRGKGFDERAARAAAEIRKKAAARGLLIRQHGVPVQALPPLTQLLNIINSGMTPDAVDNKEANGAKKEESNGHPPNGGGGNANGNQSNAGQTSQAPAGLGKGLGSLNAKKQKSKSKET
ncbi:hypothetical protein RJ641_004883 [Dillenia turbinata]|uniref:Clustered mitochondria protein n=1 Tax=Dillenia turbinata TaxID=194707 RepID=A0AAN8VJ85_9MAGN